MLFDGEGGRRIELGRLLAWKRRIGVSRLVGPKSHLENLVSAKTKFP